MEVSLREKPKTKNGFCICTPRGTALTNTFEDRPSDAKERFVHWMTNTGRLADRPDLYGFTYTTRMWNLLRREGWSVCRVVVTQRKHPTSGCSYPDVVKLTP